MSNYCLVLLSLTISSAYSAVLDLPYAEGGSDADPNTWNNPGFIRHFIPQPHFEGCDGKATPGAFDCQGTRLGLEIKPMQGLENKGYGWEGPLLVQAKLKKMGVTFKVPHKN